MNKELLQIDKLFKENKFNQVIKKIKVLINSESEIPPYYNLLGLSLSRLGKDLEAEKYFLQGIKKYTKEISLKSNIAQIQLNLKKFDEAEKNLNDAFKINKSDIFSLFVLGKLKREQNKLEEAISIFKKICEINVKFPNAIIFLGQTYLDLAQQKNDKNFYNLAEKNLLISSELFPLATGVDYTLSTIIDYSKNKNHQKKMLNKIEKIGIDENKKHFIYFAIGKSFEDQKKYEQSYQFIKLANESVNKNIDQDILKKEILKYRNIKKIFDDADLVYPNANKLCQKKIIFIIGLPRSGTTLVHQLLSSANDSYGLGESIIFNKFFEKNIFDKKFILNLFNKKKMEEEIIKISNEMGNAYNLITDKNILIDKMPPNFYWVGFIKLLFPNAKIIHTSRNVKDNFISIYKNLYGTKDMDWSYSQSNILKFIKNYNNMMSYWKQSYKNSIYELKYENLVQDKIEETKKLFTFCDLEWNEKVFEFYKNAKTIRTASINQVKRPIYQSSVNSSSNYVNYIDFFNQLKNI